MVVPKGGYGAHDGTSARFELLEGASALVNLAAQAGAKRSPKGCLDSEDEHIDWSPGKQGVWATRGSVQEGITPVSLPDGESGRVQRGEHLSGESQGQRPRCTLQI